MTASGSAVAELAGGQDWIGSMALGIGFAAMDLCAKYRRRKGYSSDKPIASQQAIHVMIADNYTRLEAARLLLLRAAFLKDQGSITPRGFDG